MDDGELSLGRSLGRSSTKKPIKIAVEQVPETPVQVLIVLCYR